MLKSQKMIGFLHTSDYAAARAFYEGKLGFRFVSQDQFALVLQTEGNMLRIVKLGNFTPLPSTVLGWEVADAVAMVDWLTSRGVATEKYPWIQDKERGVWEAPGGAKVAWFKDPDGNVLSVSQHPAG
ncbi:MAG TPA: VOC family protein [Dongiaceae bacterium]|nr:VOC family protein [Dongiaceae bacterium]